MLGLTFSTIGGRIEHVHILNNHYAYDIPRMHKRELKAKLLQLTAVEMQKCATIAQYSNSINAVKVRFALNRDVMMWST